MLERVKKFNMQWVKKGHRKGANTNNVSATVSINENEWEQVGIGCGKIEIHSMVYQYYLILEVAYTQAPFEDITEEQFNEMAQHLHNIDLSKIVEFSDNTALMDQAACAGGSL
jgi:ribonucleoside-triphosphate reductase (thioredoxin)